MKYAIALDQGTTSSRAIVFDRSGAVCSMGQYPLTQHYPQPGWVEHDPMELLRTQLMALAEAYERSGAAPAEIAAIGVTNQRETAVVWEKDTGRPIMNAIVWQCRRTAEECRRLEQAGLGPLVRQRTGLLIDAYFSGPKISWMLDHVPGARTRAEKGELLCGTVDSWLIWNLTGCHVSDYSNCSRTMLFDIDRLCWDEELCRALRVPMQLLPRPVPNSQVYGRIRSNLRGSAGDQQAALFGQGCFAPGQAKNTYGTGCFTLMNTGSRSLRSENGLLTSVGWQLDGETTYVLEGSVFNAGSTIQWLRDELQLIGSAHETDLLAESVPDNGGVYLVSAFTGLGAPYWDMYARGALLGLTRGATRAHIARAALEGIAYQVAELAATMEKDLCCPLDSLWVDGGASVSDFMMQFQADLLRCSIYRPQVVETTAAGAAYLAGLAVGLWKDPQELLQCRRLERVFAPNMDPAQAKALMEQWKKAVSRALHWAEA